MGTALADRRLEALGGKRPLIGMPGLDSHDGVAVRRSARPAPPLCCPERGRHEEGYDEGLVTRAVFEITRAAAFFLSSAASLALRARSARRSRCRRLACSSACRRARLRALVSAVLRLRSARCSGVMLAQVAGSASRCTRHGSSSPACTHPILGRVAAASRGPSCAACASRRWHRLIRSICGSRWPVRQPSTGIKTLTS